MPETNQTSSLFWIDPETGICTTYNDLLKDVRTVKSIHKYLKNRNTYLLYVDIITSMLTNNEYILLDPDWSASELENLGITETNLSESVDISSYHINSIDELFESISLSKMWKLGFFTSGTTGRPKFISHYLSVLARNVKTGDKFSSNQWGFCYNPTHFAGIQVFLQALFNKNTMVDMFSIKYGRAEEALKKYAITHISATPTYYRSIYPYLHDTYPLVERITFGGEMFDNQIAQRMTQYFPNAKFTNVYASTELGSILAGKGKTLKISEQFADRIRISDEGELIVHTSLMGKTPDLGEKEWFFTGDLVKRETDGTLQFISRKSEMVNVGGYKVNPHEIEEIILELPEVRDVIVYGRDNRITGKIIFADITLNNSVNDDPERRIQEYLKSRVQPWKIPRMIRIVDEIDQTRTGKKVRK